MHDISEKTYKFTVGVMLLITIITLIALWWHAPSLKSGVEPATHTFVLETIFKDHVPGPFGHKFTIERLRDGPVTCYIATTRDAIVGTRDTFIRNLSCVK